MILSGVVCCQIINKKYLSKDQLELFKQDVIEIDVEDSI